MKTPFTTPAVLVLLTFFSLVGCSGGGSSQPASSTSDNPNPESQPEFSPVAAGSGDKENPVSVAVSGGDTDHTTGERKTGDETNYTNRLAKETSPYLLLHAHNPVDWYPWGPEAFERAKREKKVIFLSIGYSSCHWCHVMERESFLDKDIAAFMNKHFVCVKVDREERPDVDKIYMTGLQVYNQLNGSRQGGGWPLSMFLTPAGQPFFGGTYFPARDGDRGVSTGFFTLLKRVHEVWSENSEQVESEAKMITGYIKDQLESRQPIALTPIDAKLQLAVLAELDEQFDAEYGGFGYEPTNPMRPKFPEPSNLVFLIEYAKRTKDERAIQLLTVTLERMAMGGIRDHLGGGFHRYSVDRFWRIPHFEKMLYDNGQLASVYADAYLLTGREDFKRVTDEMLTFVLREMTDESGGFYSALDAESEDVEGKFYRWTKDELEKALSDTEFELFAEVYGINAQPNFEIHFYAPQYSKTLAATAAEMKIAEAELDARLVPIRKKLFDIRAARPRPLTDTKILTGWNGLMIRGFAVAGANFKNDSYIQAASDAATFVLDELRTEDGRLLRTYGQGHAKLNAYVDDYAFIIDGLIALHDATQDRKWLDAADALMAKQIELFWDEANGGFFYTSNDHETLLARGKNPIDGARPSGGSVSAQNLVALGSRLNNPDYLAKAERTIQAVSGLFERAPSAVPRMVIAAVEWLEATAKP
jgi:uncharacterized protein YyaL (SSP411 family)